jgi:hypothetical protein
VRYQQPLLLNIMLAAAAMLRSCTAVETLKDLATCQREPWANGHCSNQQQASSVLVPNMIGSTQSSLQ